MAINMSGALPFSADRLIAEDVRTKLVSGHAATDGVFDGSATIRRHFAAAAPAGDGGRPDAQGVGKPVLSSKEVDGFFERGDSHGCEFSHELTVHVKLSANYMTLATS